MEAVRPRRMSCSTTGSSGHFGVDSDPGLSWVHQRSAAGLAHPWSGPAGIF